jgi:hypothetical protein
VEKILDAVTTGKYKKFNTGRFLIHLLLKVQHCFVSSVFMIHLFNTSCNYSKGWLIYYLLNAAMSIYLFLMFYKKNYIDKKQVSDKKVY